MNKFEATGMTDRDYAAVQIYDKETDAYQWFLVDDLMHAAGITSLG